MKNIVAIGIVGFVGIGAVAVACGGSDSGSTSDGGSGSDSSGDDGQVGADGSSGTDGSAGDGSSNDGGGGEAASDGGGPDPQSWFIANLANGPALIDMCISDTAGQFTTPVLYAHGLPAVPPHAVSAPFLAPAANPSGVRYYRYVDVSPDAGSDGGPASCNAVLLDSASNLLGGRFMLYTHGARGSESLDAPTYLSNATAGKDTVVFHGSDQNGYFNPAGGGASTKLAFGDSNLEMSAGLVGTVVSQGYNDAGTSMPFKTVSGGVVHILSSAAGGNYMIGCDLLAATKNGLAFCDPTVRAP